MIILTGESASGKSSIEKCLSSRYGFKPIISYTTRKPREGEVCGLDYYFIDEDAFNKKIKEGFFAEYAFYNGWMYGTALEDCSKNNAADKIAVLTPRGLRNINKLPDINVCSFYINVPRRDRLIKILERGDNIEEAYRRSLSDVGQFDGIEDDVDYVIQNPGYKYSINEMAELCVQLFSGNIVSI